MAALSRVARIATITTLSSSSTIMSAALLPEKPLSYLCKEVVTARNVDTNSNSLTSRKQFDLTKLGEELVLAERRREDAFAKSKTVQTSITKARMAMEFEDNEEMERETVKSLDTLVEEIINDANKSRSNKKNDNAPREANLGSKIEDYVRFKAYRHFLSTGKLIPLADCHGIRDEEYVAGACIGLSHDLSRYAVGRATELDVASVEMARDLTDSIMNQLLKFDFRNGPLRRKYDGTKYALKKLETILYELSVAPNSNPDWDEPQSKRAKLDSDVVMDDATKENEIKNDLICEAELDEIRGRLEARDEMRERLIKRCRDGQKAAKQAIFAMHRKDFKRSERLMIDCESVANELLPTVEEEPGLRYGSYASVLEEYAEAKLFFIWLKEHRIANPEEFPILEAEEYIGGLCDLTGEVGRFAVQRGTKRDTDGVKMCLETNLKILNALQMTSVPGKLWKKIDPLRRSVEKLESMLYELSLLKAGRNVPPDSVKEVSNEDNDGDDK